jgi:hypothetical protein
MTLKEWAQLVVGIAVSILAVGTAVRIAAPGIALYQQWLQNGATGPSWLPAVSTVATNVGVVSVSIVVIRYAAKVAKKGLFTSVAATLGVLQGSFVAALRHLWGDIPEWSKIALEAALMLLFAVAAFTFRRQERISKVLALGLFALPPVMIVSRAIAAVLARGESVSIQSIGGEVWFVVAALAVLTAAATLAHVALPEEEEA